MVMDFTDDNRANPRVGVRAPERQSTLRGELFFADAVHKTSEGNAQIRWSKNGPMAVTSEVGFPIGREQINAAAGRGASDGIELVFVELQVAARGNLGPGWEAVLSRSVRIIGEEPAAHVGLGCGGVMKFDGLQRRGERA